jgi:hypothetical protein
MAVVVGVVRAVFPNGAEVGEREVIEQARKRNECHAERPQKPSEPGGGGGAHPAGPRTPPFLHLPCHGSPLYGPPVSRSLR